MRTSIYAWLLLCIFVLGAANPTDANDRSRTDATGGRTEPVFGRVVRNNEKTRQFCTRSRLYTSFIDIFCYMTQKNAEEYCQSLNQDGSKKIHLPSAIELPRSQGSLQKDLRDKNSDRVRNNLQFPT